MDGSIANVGADLARIRSGERAAGSLARTPADAAKSFEAMFATLLVKEMRRALPEGFFGGGTDGDVYAGWLDQTLGEAIAKSGALRLSEKVRESLEARVETDPAGAPSTTDAVASSTTPSADAAAPAQAMSIEVNAASIATARENGSATEIREGDDR